MLNDAIVNVVDDKYRDDFKAHFHLQVAEFSEVKLIDLYKRRVIDWVCLKIIFITFGFIINVSSTFVSNTTPTLMALSNSLPLKLVEKNKEAVQLDTSLVGLYGYGVLNFK
jgi:hypothetical protein